MTTENNQNSSNEANANSAKQSVSAIGNSTVDLTNCEREPIHIPR